MKIAVFIYYYVKALGIPWASRRIKDKYLILCINLLRSSLPVSFHNIFVMKIDFCTL